MDKTKRISGTFAALFALVLANFAGAAAADFLRSGLLGAFETAKNQFYESPYSDAVTLVARPDARDKLLRYIDSAASHPTYSAVASPGTDIKIILTAYGFPAVVFEDIRFDSGALVLSGHAHMPEAPALLAAELSLKVPDCRYEFRTEYSGEDNMTEFVIFCTPI